MSHDIIDTTLVRGRASRLAVQLLACLRLGRSTRMPRRRGTDRRGQIPDRVSIDVRPPEVKDRVMPGHWQGDFIKGAGHTARRAAKSPVTRVQSASAGQSQRPQQTQV